MSSQAKIARSINPSETPAGADFRKVSNRISRPEGSGELDSLATRGGMYLTLRYGLSIVVSMANMFLLTRWIGPHAYGLFVTAVGLTTFLASLTRFGVDTYLVRCDPPPAKQQYDVAFTLVLSNSILLTVLGIAIVPLLKTWYAGDEFAPPYLILLLCVPLTAVAGIPVAKLERALNFRIVAGIELGGQVVALVIAIPLALGGFGVWAPVTGLFAWQVFAVLAACTAARFVPGLKMQVREARRMLAFGLGFSASIRVLQLRSLVNPLLVGRFAGAEGVALVAIALRIAEGIGFVRTAAGRLAIATLARLQDDRERLRHALEKAQCLQVIILGPLLCAFALCGPWLVPHLMGSRWSGVLAVYPLVSIGVLVSSVFNLQASALFVVGEQWAVLRAYACHVGLLALGTFLLLPRFGVAAYGWSELAACGGYVFLHAALKQVTPISYRRLWPLLGLFAGILALNAANLSFTTVWITAIVATIAVIEWNYKAGRKADLRSTATTDATTFQRLRTFLVKSRARGWSYVAGVAHYEWNSNLYRAHYALERGLVRLRSCTKRRSTEPTGTTVSNVIRIDLASRNKQFLFDAADIPEIVENIPIHLRTKTVEEADRILAHKFRFRGHEETLEVVDWSCCPDGNLSWQWDLNRHRFFLTLAMAHYYTAECCYVLRMTALWRSWIDSNPVGKSCNWKYPFEVAARLQNWLWAYFLLADSGFSSLAERREFEDALLEHAQYVEAHLEYHWPNNHLLLEAKALYEFATLFPELDPAGRLRSHAWRVLEREVTKQVLPDGAHVELCSMYHRIVAGELEELLALCERRGTSLPEWMQERIRRMRSFSRAMLYPDLTMPLLGDSAEDDTYLRFDASRRGYSDLDYWLWQDSCNPDSESSFPSAGNLQVFPNAGYAFLSSSDNQAHATFDFGAFSQCETPNHAHCDALSFELWANGQPLVVDPGVYLPWHDGQGWTSYFRSTGAHNTLQIDRREQCQLPEASQAKQSVDTRLLRQCAWNGSIEVAAECIQYRNRVDEVRHRREICLRNREVTIRDQVLGSGIHDVAWSFQFAPSVGLTAESDLLVGVSSRGKRLFALAARAPKAPCLELFCGQKNPLRGWISRSSFNVVPARLAQYSMQVELPFAMEFQFTL